MTRRGCYAQFHCALRKKTFEGQLFDLLSSTGVPEGLPVTSSRSAHLTSWATPSSPDAGRWDRGRSWLLRCKILRCARMRRSRMHCGGKRGKLRLLAARVATTPRRIRQNRQASGDANRSASTTTGQCGCRRAPLRERCESQASQFRDQAPARRFRTLRRRRPDPSRRWGGSCRT